MNKAERIIIAICVIYTIMVLSYVIISVKSDWVNIVSPMILTFIVSVAVNILIAKNSKKEKKLSLFIDAAPDSGCCDTLFSVNGTQWRLPHTENVSFNDALKYEDSQWRLATLEDFSLLNKCAKYTKERIKRTINIRIDGFSFYLEPRFWTGNISQMGKERIVAAAQYYPTGFQPFHGHLPDINTEEKAGVALVRRKDTPPVKTYIEVLIKGDHINFLELTSGAREKFCIGDKIGITKSRIKEKDFMLDVFSDSTRKKFLAEAMQKEYFGSSDMCFIQITEKIHHDNHIEFHGKIVPKDGVFYSN